MSHQVREVRTLRPRQRFRWFGYECEVERQARRTTFARIISGDLQGVRIQIKRSAGIEPLT
jgi:hypothetical protein